MRAYHQLEWGARYGSLGDESENRFEVTHKGWARFGLNRPNVNLSKVPAFIRHMPDYLMHDRLVECMGVGQDQTLKLKIEKLDVLLDWDHGHPVWLFVWDSHKKRWAELPLMSDLRDVAVLCPVEEFHEGKAYYAIPTDVLPVSWHDA